MPFYYCNRYMYVLQIFLLTDSDKCSSSFGEFTVAIHSSIAFGSLCVCS
ncbi:hypothetical protein Ccrd_010722 [Cynara cardunculus var. scolymus]|uniref:Uncharacterized protein n=1 Tax=Cynara cardunculus var. scolymus TaxID=59895 RepID=A0A103YKQ2_CYNCS|nr:hypothetical protein Ccrd_010722 [Cynara cardunculus var. scolymus]